MADYFHKLCLNGAPSAKGRTYAAPSSIASSRTSCSRADFTRHRLQAQAQQAVPPQHRECGAEHEWITVFVTTMVTSRLDGKHVVFAYTPTGEVTEGQDLVKQMEALGSDSSKPSRTVSIAASGCVE
ncbi:hypothetical protein C8R44DRAFT_729199 [Mycena epipterygia]|nr:hypothetical protein C8R44DRAFT_729199 [Mycena epipterygia]